MSLKLTRRDFIVGAMAGMGATLLASCTPAAKPTAAAAKEAEVKQPAGATAQPAAKGKITLRYMERDGMLGDFMRYASREYEKQNPDITVTNETAGWGDLADKVPTMVAGGTMADLAFQHGAYMLPTLAKKGAWLDLVPAADKDKHDFSIYYQWALDTCRIGPTDNLVAMPMGVHFGQNELHWNVNIFQQMGIPEPTNTMSKQQVLEMLIKVQEKLPQGSFAGDFQYGDHFTAECHARSWGGYVVSPDRKKCGLDMEKTQAAYQWGYDLVNKYHVVPKREEVQQNTKAMFLAGTMATWLNCAANAWVGFKEAVGDKFKLGHCTWPHSADEGWGTVPSCDATVVYGKTKYPDEAWGLCKMLSSFEVSKWTALDKAHMTPGAVIAAWHDKEVWDANPPYKNDAIAWDTLKPEQYGNLGVCYNTRRKEFDDLHNSEWQKMMYAEVEYNKDNIAKLTKSLQEIMDKPVP
jgi:multiple sugar transport system substrate-binding protein